MKAPNGKPSNLTPEQYKLVRTPAFKKWFGDWENDPKNASKVLDKNGEPLVVYRGFPKKIKENIFSFKYNLVKQPLRQKNTFCFYFTDNKEVAEKYGKDLSKGKEHIVKPYFLNIRNLFDIKGFGNKLSKGNTNKKRLLDQLGISKKWYEKNIIRERKNNSGFDKWFYDRIYNDRARKYHTPDEYYESHVKRQVDKFIFDRIEPIWAFFTDVGIYPYSKQKEFRYMIHDYKKFDGVSYLETTHSFGYWTLNVQNYSKTFGVFEAENIKLADGTNTTFDANNPDIRYNLGGNINNFNYTIGGL